MLVYLSGTKQQKNKQQQQNENTVTINNNMTQMRYIG